MTRYYMKQEEVLTRADALVKRHRDFLKADHKWFGIYGVPRGGVPVVLTVCALAAARGLDWRPVNDPKRADLVVDDIIDSGQTRARIKLQTAVPFDALVNKFETTDANIGWVVFPWESDSAEKTDDDTIVGTLRNRITGGAACANANVAAVFASEKEVEAYQVEIACRCRHLLDGLLLDVDGDPNLKGTPARLAKMYVREVMAGRFNHPPEITSFPNTKKLDEMYVTGPIAVRSLCAHHFAPIIGSAWIGVIPDDTLPGLSKFDRLVEWFASRPQMQEELTVQIADWIEEASRPRALAVVIKAEHLCKTWRGVKAHRESIMTTSVMRGAFRSNPASRAEFMSLVK